MNVDWLSRLPAPARRGLYFFLQSALGSRVKQCWKEFMEWNGYSPARLEEETNTRLVNLLNHALRSSPYYRKLGLVQQPGESGVDFLRRFPLLSRELVRKEFPNLVIDSLRTEIQSPSSVPSGSSYGWLVVKTGGTTGSPTAVVHDANFRDWGRSTRLYAAAMSGFPLGTPYFRLWGSEEDLFQQQRKFHLRVMRALLAEIPMNAFRMKEEDLQRYYQMLVQNSEVEHLMTYADSAVVLAEYIREKNLPPRPLKTIMSCAGTLTTSFRDTLEVVFSAKVFNKYGSRECADMACECPAQDGLHIFSPHVFVEILDPNGKEAGAGQLGQITVTLLNNQSFPMIRYQIGDVGIAAPKTVCACGNAFPRLAQVEGRVDDMLFTEEGRKVTSISVRHFVGVTANRQLIQEWQLEQIIPRKCVFRYIPRAREGLAENLDQLVMSFKKVLGDSVAIDLQEVKEIPLSATGKKRWIVNRCSPVFTPAPKAPD